MERTREGSHGAGAGADSPEESAVPVMPGERVGNLGEEKARILRTHPPQKPLEML